MSIGKRVLAAFTGVQKGDTEEAFFQVCSALDDTAQREFQAHGKKCFKQFVSTNLELITRVGFGGGGIQKLRLAYTHPDIPHDQDGCCGIEDVVYHAIRCGLYHEAKLPANISFGAAIAIGHSGGLVLPKDFVLGVTLAVVLSPVNASESMSEERYVNFFNVSLPVSKLWGRRSEFTWLIGVLTEEHAVYQSRVVTGLQNSN